MFKNTFCCCIFYHKFSSWKSLLLVFVSSLKYLQIKNELNKVGIKRIIDSKGFLFLSLPILVGKKLEMSDTKRIFFQDLKCIFFSNPQKELEMKGLWTVEFLRLPLTFNQSICLSFQIPVWFSYFKTKSENFALRFKIIFGYRIPTVSQANDWAQDPLNSQFYGNIWEVG